MNGILDEDCVRKGERYFLCLDSYSVLEEVSLKSGPEPLEAFNPMPNLGCQQSRMPRFKQSGSPESRPESRPPATRRPSAHDSALKPQCSCMLNACGPASHLCVK